MASSLLRKLSAFLRSPQGNRVVTQMRQRANNPRTRGQFASLLQRLRGPRQR